MTADLTTDAPPPAGCTRDDECPDHSACENRACINPCVIRDPCAATATCRVANHKPICTCPDGYIGSPTTDCRLRECYNISIISGSVYEYHDDEMSLTYSPRGHFNIHNSHMHVNMLNVFSAPQPECRTDPECPDHLACIREECLDPCTTLACGVNAQCSVKRHRATCTCRRGFVGDPFTICEERKLPTSLSLKHP